MAYRVVASSQAKRDLIGIKRYIAYDSLSSALRFTKKFFSKQKLLEQHSEIGRMVPEFSNRMIREIIVGNYRVIYRIEPLKKEIIILRYWHGARGIPDLSE